MKRFKLIAIAAIAIVSLGAFKGARTTVDYFSGWSYTAGSCKYGPIEMYWYNQFTGCHPDNSGRICTVRGVTAYQNTVDCEYEIQDGILRARQ